MYLPQPSKQQWPIALFIGAGVISAAVIIWLLWATWASIELAKESTVQSVEFERLAGEITHLDEVLTMSALMAASTGDLTWEERYLTFVPHLDAVINSAIKAANSGAPNTGAHQTNQANLNLIEMEERAFELVRNGRSGEALALLRSQAYQTEKALYAEGNNSFIGALRTRLADSLAAHRRNLNVSLVAAMVALIAVVGFWWLIAQHLRAQQRRLEKANLAKSDFLASMSHEIRTPMNGVLGMVDALMGTDLSAEQRKLAMTIQYSGDTLLLLLNDILDLSKIEAGHLELENVHFDLRAIVASMEGLWRSQLEAKKMDFSIAVDAEVPPVLRGDPNRLRQVLFNLISNAAKFTKEGGVKVAVSLLSDQKDNIKLNFKVTDTGIGITPEVQGRLFTKFSQADHSITRKYGGTGLGLAICKQLSELMGGEIGLESSPGQGSTFWFTIRCGRGNPKEVDAEPWTVGSEFAETSPSNQSLRILVAEDNHVNQKVVRAMLSKGGHNIEIVGDGVEAVAAVMGGDFDLVLMDVQMPEMDGVTATKKIRELPGEKGEIPIVALTANAMIGDREKYMDAGMTNYVSKPIKPAALFSAIASAVGKAQGPLSAQARPGDEADDAKAPAPSWNDLKMDA